jgi:uncharacterized membrane protein YbhN (UPF0104 family)
VASEQPSGRRYVWIGYAVAVAIVAAMAVHLGRQRETLLELTRFSLGDLSLLVVFTLLMLLTHAIVFRQLARVFGLGLPAREWFGLTVVNDLASYTAASTGGALVRAGYLKRLHGFSFTDYAALLTSGQLMRFACCAAYGLVVALAWRIDLRVVGIFALALVASVSGHVVLAFAARLGTIPRFPRLGALAVRFGHGFIRWKTHRAAALGYAASLALTLVVSVPRLSLVFEAVGSPVPLVDVLAIRLLVSVFMLVTITPGNLGIREGAVAFSAQLLGIDATAALFAALIERALNMLFVFALGALFGRLLLRDFAEKPARAPGP